jgi:hypothetical protein
MTATQRFLCSDCSLPEESSSVMQSLFSWDFKNNKTRHKYSQHTWQNDNICSCHGRVHAQDLSSPALTLPTWVTSGNDAVSLQRVSSDKNVDCCICKHVTSGEFDLNYIHKKHLEGLFPSRSKFLGSFYIIFAYERRAPQTTLNGSLTL